MLSAGQANFAGKSGNSSDEEDFPKKRPKMESVGGDEQPNANPKIK